MDCDEYLSTKLMIYIIFLLLLLLLLLLLSNNTITLNKVDGKEVLLCWVNIDFPQFIFHSSESQISSDFK